IWQHLPEAAREQESVHLTTWAEPPVETPEEQALVDKWERLLAVRRVVSKALEAARNAKTIGASTEARVALYPAAQAAEHLQGFTREQLAEAFIVSAVEVHGSDAAAPRDAVRDEAAAVAVVVSRAS